MSKIRMKDALARASRDDFVDSRLQYRGDAWQNAVTGIGTERDKTTYNVFVRSQRALTEWELSALYHEHDLAQTMVDIVPDEMLREGFTVKVVDGAGDEGGKVVEDSVLNQEIKDECEALCVDEKLADGIRWGRLYGQGGLVLGADDGRSAALPLEPEKAKGLNYLYVVDRNYLWPLTYYRTAGHPKLGQPETYMVSSTTSNVDVPVSVVHESRLVLFGGASTGLREREANMGVDYSVLQRANKVLGDFDLGWQAVGTLLQDGNQAVFKMSGLADAIAAGQGDALTKRLKAMDQARSVVRAIVVDAGDPGGDSEESFERQHFPMTGIPETLDKLMLRLSSAVRIPVTILMGQSPAGMNATGESDFRWFYDRIRSEQTRRLAPKIRRIVQVMLAARKVGESKSGKLTTGIVGGLSPRGVGDGELARNPGLVRPSDSIKSTVRGDAEDEDDEDDEDELEDEEHDAREEEQAADEGKRKREEEGQKGKAPLFGKDGGERTAQPPVKDGEQLQLGDREAKPSKPGKRTIEVTFPELWREPPEKAALRRSTLVTSDTALITAGVLTPEEVALARFAPGGGFDAEIALSEEGRRAREQALESELDRIVNPPEPPPGFPGGPGDPNDQNAPNEPPFPPRGGKGGGAPFPPGKAPQNGDEPPAKQGDRPPAGQQSGPIDKARGGATGQGAKPEPSDKEDDDKRTDADQPRDETGRWTSVAGSPVSSSQIGRALRHQSRFGLRKASFEYLRAGGMPSPGTPITIGKFPDQEPHIIDGRHRLTLASEKGTHSVEGEFVEYDAQGYERRRVRGPLPVPRGFRGDAGEWDESDHPRDEEGKFASAGGAVHGPRTKVGNYVASKAKQAAPKEFRDTFEAVMADSEFRAFVTHYTEEELGKMKATILVDGDKAGIAVKDHGDGRIEGTALFARGEAPKGAGRELLDYAVNEHGVNYLECFGERLRKLYESRGFVVQEESEFNEEYAPSDWNYEKHGRPKYYTLKKP